MHTSLLTHVYIVSFSAFTIMKLLVYFITLILVIPFLSLPALFKATRKPCIAKYYDADRFVCVCNSTYCDTFPKIRKTPTGLYQIYETSKSGKRFRRTVGQFANFSSNWWTTTILINPQEKFQTIIGWGGHFTDTAGMVYNNLPNKTRKLLMKTIFSKSGSQYTLGRVPMGSTDFSARPYSYDDVENDTALSHFQLTDEDFQYKIPLILEANKITKNKLKLIAAPWNSPLWMKTNRAWAGRGFLHKEYYQIWANYYIKFLDEYQKKGINFWSITSGNEPFNGVMYFNPINSVGWMPNDHARWIGEHLGPTMERSKYKDLKIIIFDDQRTYLPFIQEYFKNNECMKYADGIGIHWYYNGISPIEFLKFTANSKKDLFVFGTEAANGFLGILGFEKFVEIGSWQRGANYIEDIITNMWYNFTGWMDWNLFVNLRGGYSWFNNGADSPIIVNETSGEFYKQPMYYVLAHFSKFIPPGSVRIYLSYNIISQIDGIQSVAFLRPDDGIVVIVYNRGFNNKNVLVKVPNTGNLILEVEKNSIVSILFW